MVLYTLCAAGLVLLGAVIARGWPGVTLVHRKTKTGQAPQTEDAFARDLAAMLDYTGEEERDEA